MQKGLVSIIVPVFNSERYLSDTLNSIINQSFSNWECLCVDDGSTDDSVSIVNQFTAIDSRIKLHKRPSNLKKGGNSCRNYGFEISNGEYIQWFDSDDLMRESMLEMKVEALTSNQAINYVICETGYFSISSNEVGRYEQHLASTDLYLDYLEFRTKFFTPGPMFRKAFLLNMSLFNVSLKRHQEKEFFFRIILKDSNYLVINKALVLRRLHESSLSVKVEGGTEKMQARFFSDAAMFHAYDRTDLKNSAIESYFRKKFLRYGYTFFRSFSFSLMFKAISCYLRLIF